MNEKERETQAAEALERVRRDAETLGTSSLARAGTRVAAHLRGDDAASEPGGGDAVEVWGRRIGRSLSAVAFVVLLYWLGQNLKLW